MAIVEMHKAFIIGRQSYKQDVLEKLQRLNLLEISEIGSRLEDEQWKQVITSDRIPEELEDTLNKLSELDYAIDFLEKFAHEKKSMLDQLLGIRPYLTEDKFEEKLSREEECEQIYQQSHELDKELNEINSRLSGLESDSAEFKAWEKLDVPLEEIKDSELISIQLAMIADSNLGKFQSALDEQLEGYYFEKISDIDREVRFFIVCAREDKEKLFELFTSCEVTPVSLPAEEKTAAENFKQCREEMKKIEDRKKEIGQQAATLLEKIDILHSHYDACLIKQHRMEMADSIGATDQLFFIEGWIPAEDVEKLEKILSKISVEIVCETRPSLEEESPPVKVDNPAVVRPFEVVTKLYGTPTNKDVDPTLATAPFFFVFIGLTLTDAGYGILLALMSLWGLKKLRLTGMARRLFQLFFLAGVSTFIMGALTGGWFGKLFEIPPIWFDAEANPIYFLIVTFILGIIQIYAGLAIELYKKVEAGKTMDAVYDEGFWLGFLTGLLTKFVFAALLESEIIFYLGEILTYGCGLGLILTQGRTAKNIVARLGLGILSLYDVVQYASDVLSYSRLLALGLATSVIATVINQIAQMVSDVPWLGYLFMALILISGHLFNFVINLISGYVHTSRLQYVEYYSKFMVAGGEEFNPFGLQTKYFDVDLNKDES
ncbi:MAG: V-type ATP synthase subunit I [bacterium]